MRRRTPFRAVYGLDVLPVGGAHWRRVYIGSGGMSQDSETKRKSRGSENRQRKKRMTIRFNDEEYAAVLKGGVSPNPGSFTKPLISVC